MSLHRRNGREGRSFRPANQLLFIDICGMELMHGKVQHRQVLQPISAAAAK